MGRTCESPVASAGCGRRCTVAAVGALVALGIATVVALFLSGAIGSATWVVAGWFVAALVVWARHGFSFSVPAAAFFISVALAESIVATATVFRDVKDLRSDSWHYDLVAGQVAASVPLGEQLNPFSFDYVRDIGVGLGGVIKDPGFYKILGLLYSLAMRLGADPILVTLSGLNVAAFGAVGYFLRRLLLRLRPSDSSVAPALWMAFMANPFLLEQVLLIRKDLVILALFSAGVDFLVAGKRWQALALAGTFAPLRLALSGLLLSGIVVHCVACSGGLRRFVGWRSVRVGVGGLVLAAVAGLPVWKLEMAPETAAAFARDLEAATFGLSEMLQGSLWGAVVYAWAYPFPSVRLVDDLDSVVRSVFAVVWAALTGWALLTVLVRRKSRSKLLRAPAGQALQWMFLGGFVGLCAMTVLSARWLGFVVMESRYKLPWNFLASIVVAARLSEADRHRVWRWKTKVAAAAE